MIEQIRGDTRAYNFQRLSASNNIIKTLPDALYFTVKKSPRDRNFVLQKRLDDMSFDSETGTYTFIITPDDTNNLAYGDYVFDIEVIDSGVKTTIALDVFRLTDEVTWQVNE